MLYSLNYMEDLSTWAPNEGKGDGMRWFDRESAPSAQHRRYLLLIGLVVLVLAGAIALIHTARTSSAQPNEELTPTYVQYRGREYRLLDTYVHPEEVKSAYVRQYADVLKRAQAEYDLPELDETTASDYKRMCFVLSEEEDVDDISDLVVFLDYYENPGENKAIEAEIRAISHQAESGELTEAEAEEQISYLLPNFSQADD